MALSLFVLSALLAGAMAGDLFPSYPSGLFNKGYPYGGVAYPAVGVAKVAAVPAYPLAYGYGKGGVYGGYPAYPAGYGYGKGGYYGGYPYGGVAYPAYGKGGYGFGDYGYGYGYPAVGVAKVAAPAVAKFAVPVAPRFGVAKVGVPVAPAVGVAKVPVAVPVAKSGVGVKVGSPDPLAYDVFDDFSFNKVFGKKDLF